MPALILQGNQLTLHAGLLHLRPNHVLLGGQPSGVAHLGDLLQARHQVEDFAGQLLVAMDVLELRVSGLDAGGELRPSAAGAAVGATRVEFGDLPLQVALAEPWHVLHQQVARAADSGRRQRRVLLAHAGDVTQFGTKLRVRQGAGRRDPLGGGFSLVTHRGVFRIAAAGEVQQRLDVGTKRDVLGMRNQTECPQQHGVQPNCARFRTHLH